MKILATVELSVALRDNLEAHHFEIKEARVAQEQLGNYTKKNDIEILILQHTGLLSKMDISSLTHLKALVFVGTYIDIAVVDFARSQGIEVIWAEESFANATAELVFAHLLNGCRLLPEANRNMPLEGDTSFKFLQETYSSGIEISGKTLGIVGMNAAGLKVAQKALALGMEVVYTDAYQKNVYEEITLSNGIVFPVHLKAVSLDEVLEKAHFITIHTARFERYLMDGESFQKAQKLVGIINCAYPEAVNEVALVDEINAENILFAGLDRFEEEPQPAIQVLMQPAFSLSPNINAATQESKEALWFEVEGKIIRFKNESIH